MKVLRGSVDHQLNQIFLDSKIFVPGTSRHKDKNCARDILSSDNEPGTSQNISRLSNIYSYSSAQDYKDTWHLFGRYAKRRLGIKDMTTLNADHIVSYLEKRIDDRISLNTWKKEAAHLGKLQNALDLFSKKYGIKRNYADFRIAINSLRPLAKKILSLRYKKGGYIDPVEVINAVENYKSKIVAKIQLEGGARLREAVLMKKNQLCGLCKDPITKKPKGKVHLVDTKGGKPRDIFIFPDTFRLLQMEIEKKRGQLSIAQKTYMAHIAAAAKLTGESNRGTHDFRYCFAQNRYAELTGDVVGMCHEQVIQQISWEMGHERASITMHYL
jgi:integrase